MSGHAITATERDAIVAALTAGIFSVDEIASAFRRSTRTVGDIRLRAGISKAAR